jgi:hypothetical protein
MRREVFQICRAQRTEARQGQRRARQETKILDRAWFSLRSWNFHPGPNSQQQQQPATASNSQQQPATASNSQQQPATATASNSQQQPATASNSQQQPATASNS